MEEENNNCLSFQYGEVHTVNRGKDAEKGTRKRRGEWQYVEQRKKKRDKQTPVFKHTDTEKKDSRRTCSLSSEIKRHSFYSFNSSGKKKAINGKGRFLPKESKDLLPRSLEKNCTSRSCERVWNSWQIQPCCCHDTARGKRHSTHPSTVHTDFTTCQSDYVLQLLQKTHVRQELNMFFKLSS